MLKALVLVVQNFNTFKRLRKAKADIIAQSILGLPKQPKLCFSLFHPDLFQNQPKSSCRFESQTNSSTTFKYKPESNSTSNTKTEFFFKYLGTLKKTNLDIKDF